MDQFLERHYLPKFTQKETDNLYNGPMLIKEIESIINDILKRKHQAQMTYLVNSIIHQRKIICQYSTISFRRQRRVNTQVTKPDNMLQENNSPISLMNLYAKYSTKY